MSPLLRKPFGDHGKVHEITPQSAGWRHVGFSLYRLRPGESAAEALPADREVILVIVEGKARITTTGPAPDPEPARTDMRQNAGQIAGQGVGQIAGQIAGGPDGNRAESRSPHQAEDHGQTDGQSDGQSDGHSGDRAGDRAGGPDPAPDPAQAPTQTPTQTRDWGVLGDRMDVFEKSPPHCLYLPPGQAWRATAETPCTLAVCSAPILDTPADQAAVSPRRSPRRLGPEGITLTQRGEGTNTRWINNIAMEAENAPSALLVTEVFTPAGNWSSYPSHRHDEDDFPRITYLEETYYHRVNPSDGWALQRVYTDDNTLDECIAVKNHDVTLIPKGHHPCAAPHGIQLYYLNVMAGPKRAWRFQTAPEMKSLEQKPEGKPA